MNFRLRYLQHDLELAPGEFLIGRSAECQLSLDDPLVSRRHAMLVVTESSLRVRDLGSRNGVLVNGVRIDGDRALADGDTLTIGAQVISLTRSRAPIQAGPAQRKERAQTLTWIPSSTETAEQVSAVGLLAEASKRFDSLQLLGTLAEKALALGKVDEAERILATVLGDVLKASERDSSLPISAIEQAGRYATKLAAATGKGSWADYVVKLYSAVERPLPAPIIDELHAVLRKVSADLAALRAYVEKLRVLAASFGPAERFLVQRIEGLERLASLR